MTNDLDPIERAIDDAAGRMTAQVAPDLRARVAAHLEHPTPHAAWRLPAAAAAAIALIAIFFWPPAQQVESPRRAAADILLFAPAAQPLPAAARAPVVRPIARRAASGASRSRDLWPDIEETIEPLVLQPLALQPIDAPIDERPAPLDVAPLALPPLALTPLSEPDRER